MSATLSLLSDLPAAIVAEVDLLLPDLKECKAVVGPFDLKKLKAGGYPAPAVLISRMGARQGKTLAGNLPTFEFRMAAFVITRSAPGLDRDTAAANICAALLKLVPENRWALAGAGAAHTVGTEVLVASNDASGIHLSAVTWLQPLMLAAVPAQEIVPIELYARVEPGPGGDHVEIGADT